MYCPVEFLTCCHLHAFKWQQLDVIAQKSNEQIYELAKTVNISQEHLSRY